MLGFVFPHIHAFLPSTMLCTIVPIFALAVVAQSGPEVCPRPAAGSTAADPVDLRSQNGSLKVALVYRSFVDSHGLTRYCYIDEKNGSQSPTFETEARR